MQGLETEKEAPVGVAAGLAAGRPPRGLPRVDLHRLLAAFVRRHEDGMVQRGPKWLEGMANTIGGSEMAEALSRGRGRRGRRGEESPRGASEEAAEGGEGPSPGVCRLAARKVALRLGRGDGARAGGEPCWWGTLFEDEIGAYVAADLGGAVVGDEICVRVIPWHRNSPDGYIVAWLCTDAAGGGWRLWTTDMDPALRALQVIFLLEFKCPASRLPDGRVPSQYRPQVWSGLAVSPVAHAGLFVDAAFRKCAAADLGDNARYDLEYHSSDVTGGGATQAAGAAEGLAEDPAEGGAWPPLAPAPAPAPPPTPPGAGEGLGSDAGAAAPIIDGGSGGGGNGGGSDGGGGCRRREGPSWELPVAWGLIGVYAPRLDAPRHQRLGWRGTEWAPGDPDPDQRGNDAAALAWQLHAAHTRGPKARGGPGDASVDLGAAAPAVFRQALQLIDAKRFTIRRHPACFADGRGADLHREGAVAAAVGRLRAEAPPGCWLFGFLPWKLFDVCYVPVARRPGFAAEIRALAASVHALADEACAAPCPEAFLAAKMGRAAPGARPEEAAAIQDLFDEIASGGASGEALGDASALVSASISALALASASGPARAGATGTAGATVTDTALATVTDTALATVTDTALATETAGVADAALATSNGSGAAQTLAPEGSS